MNRSSSLRCGLIFFGVLLLLLSLFPGLASANSPTQGKTPPGVIGSPEFPPGVKPTTSILIKVEPTPVQAAGTVPLPTPVPRTPPPSPIISVGKKTVDQANFPGKPIQTPPVPPPPKADGALVDPHANKSQNANSKTASQNVQGTDTAKTKKEEKKMDYANMTTAIFETSEGTFRIKLFDRQTPKTVANFIGLAEGTKEWVDSKTGDRVKKKFYDNLTFHRVIPDFMIQGGCPLGDGRGGPGNPPFEDEIVSSLKHSKPGILSMANSGPNTNGSQFFITVKPTPWLDGKHTIFGEVVEGMDIVTKISKVTRDVRDKPVKPVIIRSLKIVHPASETKAATPPAK